VTQTRDRTLSGVGLVLVGIGSVQIGAGVATFLFPLAGPGGAVWLRLLLSAVLLAVLWPPSRLPWAAILRRRRGDSRQGGDRQGGDPQGLGWDGRTWWTRTWWTVVAFGVVLAGMNWSFYESLARIPLGIAVAIEFAGPLALSMALSRRWTDAAWAVLAAAGLAGLTLIGAGTHGADLIGIGFAAIAGALWACYILISQRVGRLVPGMRGLSVALVIGAILTTPVGLAAGSRLWDWQVVGLAAAVALLSTAVAYGAELEALRRLPARVFGVLMSIEPALAALIGLVLLGQLLAPGEWWGIAAICLASVGATLTAHRRTSPDPP